LSGGKYPWNYPISLIPRGSFLELTEEEDGIEDWVTGVYLEKWLMKW